MTAGLRVKLRQTPPKHDRAHRGERGANRKRQCKETYQVVNVKLLQCVGLVVTPKLAGWSVSGVVRGTASDDRPANSYKECGH